MSLNRCRFRVIAVFGVLLVAALAILPVRTTTVILGRDPLTNAVWRKTSSSSGFLFAPAFLRRRSDPLPDEKSYAVRYALRRSQEVRANQIRLNVSWWLIEIVLIVVLGALDLVFLCRRRPARFPPKP